MYIDVHMNIHTIHLCTHFTYKLVLGPTYEFTSCVSDPGGTDKCVTMWQSQMVHRSIPADA